MDGEFWDLDMSTPSTLGGLARPVPGHPLPLGLTRGARLSRPNQIDFFQRFMAMPFVPSYTAHGFSLQRILNLTFSERWSAMLLGQFNLQKFVSSIRENRMLKRTEFSWLQSLGRLVCNKSLYALGVYSELLVTPDDMLLVSLEGYGDNKTPRNKAVLHHKFQHHNLTVEAAWPELFLDQIGTYWDVPFSVAIDLASVAHDSGASYHLSMSHNAGPPRRSEDQQIIGAPANLLPGLCVRTAIALKKSIYIWRSKGAKLKMVQPFDIFLANPRILASGILGAVATASLGENAIGLPVENEPLDYSGFRLRASAINSAFFADVFASISLSAQHGNFQKLFFDLSRVYARLDFPSGSNFLSGITNLALGLYNSKRPNLEAVQAVCPNVTFSIQQQIAGPFSFKVDSGVAFNLAREDQRISVRDPVYAIEYALQVLGSAKAIAWYSPKKREFMVELRFFETNF